MSEPPTPSGPGPDKPWSDPTAGPGSSSQSRGEPSGTPPPGGESRTPQPPSAGQQQPGSYPPPGGYPPQSASQAGGYQPPGGFSPPGGYPPGGYQSSGYYGGPPPGFANSEDKTWALVAHFGGAAGMLLGGGCAGWIAPLVAMLARGNQSPTVRAHAVAALNFQLLWSIVGVVGWILTCIVIGFFGVAAAMAMGTIFGVIAGLRANEGQLYRYPGSPPLVR